VAIGTDGYPSDGAAETGALVDEARAHGDDPDAVARRPEWGHALLAERFGQVPPAGTVDDTTFATITAEATAEAARLWERMAKL
jgi:hypothetical protein